MKRQRSNSTERIQEQPQIDLAKFFKAPDEFSHEEYMAGLANPYNFRSWWNSIQAIPPEQYQQRAIIYQRSLQYLPGSYKLWYNFLRESRKFVKQFEIIQDQDHYEVVNDLHEKALVYMNKMPKIWIDYAKFLSKQKFVTRTRKVYDRALISLPVTQHELIWSYYLEWSQNQEDNIDTAIYVYSRYIEFNPSKREEYIDFLLTNDLLEQALKMYHQILSDSNFVSVKKKTQYQLWMEFCEFISKNPTRCPFDDGDQIIRHGIRKYTDEVGKLWIFLAEYYTRLGLIGKARDVFEEALTMINTARDFGIIYNAYMKFEEQIIENEEVDQESNEEDEEEEDDQEFEDQIDALIEYTLKDVQVSNQEEEESEQTQFKFTKEDELDLRFFRLENLIQRRPFLLSNTVLRQNPNNVYEWLNRIKLCVDDPYQAIKTFTQAIQTIDPQQALGKPSQIWIEFANFYEKHENIENANQIYFKATQLNYKHLDELASIYCAWAEMHIRHRNYQSAISIMQQPCTTSKRSKKNKQNLLYNNSKVWSLYVDLLENLSTIDDTKMAYDKMMDLKIATPQNIMNYASFLQRNNYYEESFRIYERAINLFEWPHVYEIWANYLSKMIERYADSKVERIRDLFEQVLKQTPTQYCKLFYYMYGDYEENFGLLNHAMQIYDRASKEFPKEDRFEVINLNIAKAAEFFGIQKTRQLYERSFEILNGSELIEIGLRFAKLERKLGEIERARGIYQHLSQFSNPRIKENEEKFWSIWEKFEVYHGNEDTYSDYIKTKRSVELRYSITAPILSSDKASANNQSIENIEGDDMIQ